MERSSLGREIGRMAIALSGLAAWSAVAFLIAG
jgi:hypothetical protein